MVPISMGSSWFAEAAGHGHRGPHGEAVRKLRPVPITLLHKRLPSNRYCVPEAAWRSGYAADCKSVYSGSIPDVASSKILGKFKNLTQDGLAL